jgi:hypothetical protein
MLNSFVICSLKLIHHPDWHIKINVTVLQSMLTTYKILYVLGNSFNLHAYITDHTHMTVLSLIRRGHQILVGDFNENGTDGK